MVENRLTYSKTNKVTKRKLKQVGKTLLQIGGAVSTLILGIFVYFDTRACWRGVCWDWDGVNQIAGPAIVVLSLIMIGIVLYSIKNKKPEVVICPQCEAVFPFHKNETNRCPGCGVPLEPLDGFYERHPERGIND